MRRWNGWGDDAITYHVPKKAAAYIVQRVGAGTPLHDVSPREVVASVPASRLPAHPLVSIEPAGRVRHARGQSLPDLVALHSGRIAAFPDGVAYPTGEDEIVELVGYARDAGAVLIPYGGGTSVVGHINPQPGDAPVLTLDLGRMNRLLRFDATSELATFGPGVAGPDLEAQLRARGYTLGHYPQSFEYSTLGGWIATRSSGQQSLGYGRIEDMFAGCRLISPAGTLDLPPFPASAAGPDLRQVVLGCEGRLGLISEATVRVSPAPARESFHALFLPDWERAVLAARQIVQARLPLSMLRLSTPEETFTMLTLAGHERLIGGVERLLSLRGMGEGKCMLLLGFTSQQQNGRMIKATRDAALGIAGAQGAIHVGRRFGNQWHKGRFRTPYLRNTLWEMGYAVDTLETATTWSQAPEMVKAIEAALHQALDGAGDRVHVFTHLSHVYPSGCSVYTTYLFRLGASYEDALQRWQALKSAGSQAVQLHGGTISHQHGVGTDHLAYLPAEKGELGLAALADFCKRLDPERMMNPGKLLA